MESESLDNESDGQLIRRYAEGRDERAFAKLVERRGALVAGACARMLPNHADAEDAFQAVFLVLARRAYALRRQASLAAWLHGVAVRVCLNDRKKERRRQFRVQEAAEVAQEQEADQRDGLEELKLLIDMELAALPKRLREVLVLCDLEGRTREEVARSLSVPLGTVSSRLARGRAAMRKRLARYDLTIATGGVALVLARSAEAAPAVSAVLVKTTVHNAHTFLYGTAAAKATLGTKITTLAEGALYAMIVNRWKVAVCLVALFAITLLGGTVAPSIAPRLVGTAFGATVLFDDFEDGSVTDGTPVGWRTPLYLPNSIFNVVQGDLQVSAPSGIHVGAVGVDHPLGDTSIRAVVRINGVGDQNVGIVARANDQNGLAHAAEIEADGDVFIGVSGIYRSVPTNLEPAKEDVVLQLDVIGNTIKVWAWRAGEPMPPAPLLIHDDASNQIPIGLPGVYSGQSVPPQPTPSTAIFRSVHVATTPIPEPRAASLAAAGGSILAGGMFLARRRVWLAI